jgi:hypothetical protein
MDTCSWWAILTARITVRTASHRRLPALAIISRRLSGTRGPRERFSPDDVRVSRVRREWPGHGRSLRALGRPMRIRFITDLPRVVALRSRSLPSGDSGPIERFAARGCPGQGSDDPSLRRGAWTVRCRPRSGAESVGWAGTLRRPAGSVMAVAGVITMGCAQETHRIAPADGMALAGVNRCRDIGGAAPAGVPIPGAGLGGSCVPGSGLARVPGMAIGARPG